MEGCFFPSHAWQGDGEDVDLNCYVHRGPSCPPCPDDAVAGGRFPASPVICGTSPSSSSSSTSTSSCVGVRGSEEEKDAAASRVHCLAERRRRERINGHLSALRGLIPNPNNKMDKASLLASVIHEIRVLKEKAVDVSRSLVVPMEVNHVYVECEQSNEQANTKCTPLIKASICCGDRPNLFADIMEAFHSLRVKAIRADMVSLGGRVQSFFVLSRVSSDGDMRLSSLMESMKLVLGRVASMGEEESTHLSSKRRRFFQPHYSDNPF